MQKQRKQVTKHKDRTIREVKSSRCGRLMISALAMLLLWTGAGNVAYAGTAIHHHSGDEENGGDCYQTPVYHTHDGSTGEGGDCYQEPVYHVHEGNQVNGGGCYGKAVYHVHTGNTQTGGTCYTPIYHSHTDNCYEEGSHNSNCKFHLEYHPYDCGTVHDWDGDGHGCDGFYNYECGGHRSLACGQDGQIVGYTFACTMSADTLIGYTLNCGRTGADVDAYELTCEKTEEDIDYYQNTCGMEEGEEYYVPDPEPEQSEDHSEPERENDQESTQPESGRETSDDSGASSDDSGASSDNGSQENTVWEPVLTPSPEPVVTPTPVPTPEPVAEAEPVSTPKPAKTVVKPSPQKMAATPTPVATTTPEAVKRVTEEVKVSPVKAQPVDTATEPVVIKKTNPLLTPAGKIISITSGTVILALLIGWLLFYLRRSVRVYNDNGKGTMRYLGRAAVELTEEGYCINLTDKLVERAGTNRYSIRPDLFLIGKNSNWEVFIVRDGKKKAVYLEKEIRITI